MAVFFSGGELIEMAKNIEKNGRAFYEALMQRTKNPDARVLYDYLAGQEKKHLVIFEEIGKRNPLDPSPETYPGEYRQYLKALADNAVFTGKNDAIARARDAANEMDALNVGIEAEKESIIFYAELTSMIKESDQGTIRHVVDEEKRHLTELNDLKRVLETQKAKT